MQEILVADRLPKLVRDCCGQHKINTFTYKVVGWASVNSR